MVEPMAVNHVIVGSIPTTGVFGKNMKYKDIPEERKRLYIKQGIERRKRYKRELVEYKGGKCEKCGYDKCLAVLSFHHKNRENKKFKISGSTKSFKTLKKEVNKCILLCANCHLENHYSGVV